MAFVYHQISGARVLDLSSFTSEYLTGRAGHSPSASRLQRQADANADAVAMVVNLGNYHWTCVFADYRARIIDVYDPYQTAAHRNLSAAMARYLDLLDRQRRPRDDSDSDDDETSVGLNFDDWTINHAAPGPRQPGTNGCDCGVFVLAYLYCRSLGVRPAFTEDDMPSIRARFAAAILAKRMN